MAAEYLIEYRGRCHRCRDDETLLEAFMRQGVEVPFSCRSGVCHTCMHRCETGEIPPRAQRSLDEHQRRRGYFLLCRCTPTGDMRISLPSDDDPPDRGPPRDEQQAPPPDPQLWSALDQGRRLFRALEDFYRKVYQDPKLAPFFEGVTQRRVVEKQYNFLYRQITGKPVYFGERPRNAHHWMVISDALFDHRENLLEQSLREQGLPENMIARLRALDESFRTDIVKDKPWNRQLFGRELPVEGYEYLVLDAATLCDRCGREVDAGTRVRCHVRLGTLYCPACAHLET